MIELPDDPGPNGLEYALIDYGTVQRGASSLRVDRPGSRFLLGVSYPPMQPDTARKFVARLQRAKSEGIRLKLPLLGVSQGVPGSPVVNGAGQSGKVLNIRGLTAAYAFKEGFWLTITGADGTSYLHSVSEPAVSTAGGLATVEIEPMLREAFADGAVIELGAPFIEGFIDGDSWSWTVPVNRLIAVAFSVEEYR